MLVLVLLFNLLDDVFNFDRLTIVDAKVVLVLLQRSAHSIESLGNLAALISDQALSEQALSASVIITAEFFAHPVKNDREMLLSLVIENHWGVHLIVVLLDHEVVLNDVVLPDLHNLLEESLGALELAHRREERANVEIALAEVD